MNSFSELSSGDAPAHSDLEVSVFGPGTGESILLHLGQGEWAVIDSCIFPGEEEPISLTYLRNLGLNPADCIKLVAVTHFHDDHIKGAAQILRECPQAKFVMSAALNFKQFVSLALEADSRNKLVSITSSAAEFVDIFEVLQSRATSSYATGPHTYADDGKRLFKGGYKGKSEVWALSPSAATVTNANISLADMILVDHESKRFKSFSENDLSVAMLVKAENYTLLLGADLENTTADTFGWKAVLNSTLRPPDLSSVFKVAHHGSPNADHEQIWIRMLNKNPIAIITPYKTCRTARPSDKDIKRISSRTANVYLTTPHKTKRPPKRRGIDGDIAAAVRSHRTADRQSGFVQVRLDLTCAEVNPRITLFGNALKL